MTARGSPFLLAALHAVACTFPSVTFEDGGKTTEASTEPAPDGKVDASVEAGETDSTMEARAEATVDTSTTDVAPPREGGGDVATVYDSATTDAGTIDDGPLDVLEPNCDCGPGQSLYPTNVQCGLLNTGLLLCAYPAGFVNLVQPCGTTGEFITCAIQGLACATTSDTMKVQECH